MRLHGAVPARSVLLGCTSSHHTTYRGRWKEYMGTGPARREGWCRSASCPTIHMKLSGCFLSLEAVSSTRRSREQPGIPCIDPSCSCANCRRQERVHVHCSPPWCRDFGPGQLQRLEVGDIGGSTASGVASSLVTQRIAAPELSLVHSTVLYRAYGQGETAARLTEVSFCLLVGGESGPVLPRSDGDKNSLTIPPTSRCRRTILGPEERSAASDLATPEEEPAGVRTDIRPSLAPVSHVLDIASIQR